MSGTVNAVIVKVVSVNIVEAGKSIGMIFLLIKDSVSDLVDLKERTKMNVPNVDSSEGPVVNDDRSIEGGRL